MVKSLYKAVILVAAFFVSCDSKYSADDLADLAKTDEALSVETATGVSIVYTDSGIMRAKIFAPLMKRYPDAEDPYLEMPDGVKAVFYNERGEVQSTLVGNYAINYEAKDLITIRDSVRVVNKNDEEIKSDELHWDKKERKIYSDKDVRIRERNEKILYGKGFESNETFTKYRIKQLTGTVLINQEGEDE
ncbi:LPS export ABC transporter periplasmic protein LptC [bacterium]|nr:LPS export ABC transporter periplasmic protein LptC [bacterium]